MVPSRWPAGAADGAFLDGPKLHICSALLTKSVTKPSCVRAERSPTCDFVSMHSWKLVHFEFYHIGYIKAAIRAKIGCFCPGYAAPNNLVV